MSEDWSIEAKEYRRYAAKRMVDEGKDVISLCKKLRISQRECVKYEADEVFREAVGKLKRAGADIGKGRYVVDIEKGSKFDPSVHPKRVQELFRRGMTEAEVRNDIGVTRGTIERWRSKYEIFQEAYERGLDGSHAWWADFIRRGVSGEVSGFNVAGTKFMMKNMFREDYDEDRNIKVEGSVVHLSDDELRKRIAVKMESIKELEEIGGMGDEDVVEGDYEEIEDV